MIALIIVALVILCIVSTVAFFVTSHRYVLLVVETRETEGIKHAMCIAHVSHYVGNHFAASVLKAAAEDYSRPETQRDLMRINNERWVQDGPSTPSIWLAERADALIEEVNTDV